MCLAVVGQTKIPTSCVVKDDLLRAGKIVEFPTLECSAEDFRDVIYENFPNLRRGGGFEFCRCLPNSRELEPLSSTAQSSPLFLKERVGKSRTYIRPLQLDLSLDEVTDLPEGVCCMHSVI